MRSGNVSVFTNKYESEHGKKPRGLGSWWFKGKVGGLYKVYMQEVMPYSQAKKNAQRWAAEKNCSVISLLA